MLICEVWFGMSRGHATTLPPIFPFASSNIFLSPFIMTLLTALAYPFPWGYVGVEYLFRNSQVTTVSFERFAIKLKAIVRNEGTRDPELCDNVFPNKFLSIHILDICQGLSFNPLSEVVHVD